MSLAIVSGGQHALILGDVAVHPAQLTNIDWTFIFEMDPEQAISTRQEVFDRAEAQNAPQRRASVTWLGWRGGATGREFRC